MAPGKRKRAAPTQTLRAAKKGRTSKAQKAATDPQTSAPAEIPLVADPDWWDPHDLEKVRMVKGRLHVSFMSTSGLPLGREREAEQLQAGVRTALEHSQGGFIYVSGMPGIGKTMTARAVLLEEKERLHKASHPHVCAPALISINCMTDGGSVMARLAEGMERCTHRTAAQAHANPLHQPTGAVSFRSSADAEKRIRSLMGNAMFHAGAAKKPRGRQAPLQVALWVVILDELDGLLERAGDVRELERLLAMARAKDSRLLLLGISNSSDLLERRLADLHIKVFAVQKVIFEPYTRPQLAAILRQRLEQLPGPVFEAPAVGLCAGKVAADRGDVRRLLSACEAAVNILAADAAALKQEAEAAGGGTPRPEQRLVGLDEVDRAVAQLTGSGAAGGDSEVVASIRALPADQKLALIAAYQLIGDDSSQASSGGGGSSQSSATEFFLRPREDSNDSFASTAAKGRVTATGGKQVGAQPGTGKRGGAFGCVRRDCMLGALHRQYQALCKQMVHKEVRTLAFGEFQCTVTDLMTRVLACRLAKNRAESTVTLLAPGPDILKALGDSHVYRMLLSGGRSSS